LKISENFRGDENFQPDVPAGELGVATELRNLAKLPPRPTPRDLAMVEGWVKLGTPARIKTAIAVIMGRGDTAPQSLAYFDKGVREALAVPVPRSTPQAAPSPPRSAESVADQAIRALIGPANTAWNNDRTCPFPPNLEGYKAACDGGEREGLARRWLAQFTAWDQAGRDRDLKPPDFSQLTSAPTMFGRDLIEAELAAAKRSRAPP